MQRQRQVYDPSDRLAIETTFHMEYRSKSPGETQNIEFHAVNC
jgi:hypothetical protein